MHLEDVGVGRGRAGVVPVPPRRGLLRAGSCRAAPASAAPPAAPALGRRVVLALGRRRGRGRLVRRRHAVRSAAGVGLQRDAGLVGRSLEELAERREPQGVLIERRVLPSHGVLHHAGQRKVHALALQCHERLGQQVDGVLARPAAPAAARRRGHAVVIDELIAVGDEQLARALAVAEADDALVQFAQLADQRREVAVAGHDDEVVEVLARVRELHGVHRQLDVGAVLRALARRGHLDELEARVLQVHLGFAIAAPVRVCALDDHAALLRQAAEDEVNVEVASGLGARSRHVLEVDQHGEHVLCHVGCLQ